MTVHAHVVLLSAYYFIVFFSLKLFLFFQGSMQIFLSPNTLHLADAGDVSCQQSTHFIFCSAEDETQGGLHICKVSTVTLSYTLQPLVCGGFFSVNSDLKQTKGLPHLVQISVLRLS